MLEVIEKMLIMGGGLWNLTKEKAEQFVDTLIEKGQLEAKDKKRVLSKLLDGTKQLDQQLEDRMKGIARGVTSNTEKLVKNTEKQIDTLHRKIADLSAKLEKARQRQAPAPKASGGKKTSIRRKTTTIARAKKA